MSGNIVSSSSSSGEIGFLGLMTVVLMTLKLTGYIAISWWLVFAPVLFPFAILLLIGLGVLVYLTIPDKKKGKK